MSLLTAFGNGSSASGSGPYTVPVPNLGKNNIPLLSTFYFNYRLSGPVDHQINSIFVLPGGNSHDLSPDADLSPNNLPAGELTFMIANTDESKKYSYEMAFVPFSTLPGAEIRGLRGERFQYRDVGNTGTATQVIPPSPIAGATFVLCGFYLYFTGDRNKYLKKISILEDNGVLTIDFQDNSTSSVYGYLIDYAWVSGGIAEKITIGEETGTASGGQTVSLPGEKVIRGFSFEFVDGNHSIQDFGILSTNFGFADDPATPVIENNSNLEVIFEDKSEAREFQWKVRWASFSAHPVIKK
jgi:hypothetical protein